MTIAPVRALFGAYFAVMAARLLPWAEALYGGQGLLADATNPLAGLTPLIGAPEGAATALVVLLGVAAVSLGLGFRTRTSALVLWAAWAALWHRNAFTLNPSLPTNGFLMLAFALLPADHAGSVDAWLARRRGRPVGDGRLPADLTRVVWVVMTVAYTFSGATKLGSPSWVSGEALGFVLDGPLARPTPWVAWLVAHPIATHALTWGSLAVELAAAPLALSRSLRPVVWLSLVGLHLGILATVQFAELTLGMLLIHAWTFDPRWVRALGPAQVPQSAQTTPAATTSAAATTRGAQARPA